MEEIIKNRSVLQIQTDRKNDKKLEENVTKGGRRIVCFSLRDDNVIMSGDELSVQIVENEDITIKVLKEQLKAIGEPREKGHNLRYVQSKPYRLLPPMRVKIGGRKWSIKTGRIQVTEYMTALGYGRGGVKSYKEDKPSWWPQQIAWERCEHPYDLTSDECKTILETIIIKLLKEDPEKYHYGKEEDNEKVKDKRVRKRTKSDAADKGEKGKRTSQKSKALIDNTDTEDELEEGEVLDEEEEDKEEQLSDESLGDDVTDALDLFESQPPAKKKKTTAKSKLRRKAEMPKTTTSDYEKIQAKNIAEKNQMRANIFHPDV